MTKIKILLLFFISLICINCKKINNTDKDISLNDLNHENKVIFHEKWKDKLSDNSFTVKKIINDNAKDGEDIFKLTFELSNSLGTVIIKDSIFDCPVETDLDLIKESFGVSDIDGNGFKEVSFAYYKYCRGDSHPDSLKLVVLENNKKMFVKGLRTNEMDKTIAEYQKKEYSGFGIIDEENISKKLREEMFVKWYQFSHENEMYSQVKASEYFLSLKRKEANFINPLEEWQGEYIFKYGRTDSYQSLSAKERFLIDAEDSSKVIAIKKLFIEETSETITSIDTLKLKITKATKDSLILKREKDFIYKISKDVDGNYKIGGRDVYTLSPPNNNYPLTKK